MAGWTEATPYAIEVDAAAEAWHAGHVTDMLELGDGGLLVAAETGGVWMIASNGTAMPLSDGWDDPNVDCLARGPDGPRHFYAGCQDGSIWQTDASAALALFAWVPVVGSPPLAGGRVRDLVVIPTLRLIVAACARGLFWANIPAGTAAPYLWREAVYTDSIEPGDGFFSVSMGLTTWPDQLPVQEGPDGFLLDQRHLDHVTIVAGGMSRGMFTGQWRGAPGTLRTLEVHRAAVGDQQGVDITPALDQMRNIAVDTCDRLPNVGFAVAGEVGGKQPLSLVARTDDGGRTWQRRDARIDGKFLGEVTGDWASWNSCISAHPSNGFSLAIGWQAGTFWSKDAGATFAKVAPNSPHLHADVHVLRHTRPSQAGGNTLLYIGSDGGLASNWLATDQCRSDYNRGLRNLQLYSPHVRMFYGTLAAHPAPGQRGLAASGTQDNGNIYCRPAPDPTPWRQIDGCDGGPNIFLATGELVRSALCGEGGQLEWASVDGDKLVNQGKLPLKGTAPAGLAAPGGSYADGVTAPRYRNPAGQQLTAVVGKEADVFGVFSGGPGGPYLEHLARLPIALPVYVSAVGSYDGLSVFAGTTDGRIFVVDGRSRGQIELTVRRPPIKSATTPHEGGTVVRIAQTGPGEALALLNGTNHGHHYLLRLNGFLWEPATTGLTTTQPLFALAHDPARPKRVFVATDDRVHTSDDGGATWRNWSEGLPRRPHCSDLRLGMISGRPHVYLGTYGRSMWIRATDEALTALRSAQLEVTAAEGLAGVSDYAQLSAAPVNEHWDRLCAALYTLANAYRAEKDPPMAAGAMDNRSKTYTRMAAADPDRYQVNAGLALVDMLDFRTGGGLGTAAALAAAERAVAILEELAEITDYDGLAALEPNLYWPWPYLDRAIYYLAHTQREHGRPVEAAATMGRRVLLYERLAAVEPEKYQVNVGLALVDSLDFRAGGAIAAGPARQIGERAVSVLQALAGAEPNLYWPWPYLDRAIYYLAHTQREDGHPAPAAATMARRVGLYERLAAVEPEKYQVNVGLALVDSLDFRAGGAIAAGPAREIGERAVSVLEALAGITSGYDALAGIEPNLYWTWPYLDRALYYLAHTEREDGRPVPAAATMRKRVKLYERLAVADPATYRAALAQALLDEVAFAPPAG